MHVRKQKTKVGERYGKLTVIEHMGPHTDHHFMSKVRCDCGEVIVVRDSILIRGKQIQCRKCAHASYMTHGLTDTPLFHCWQHMRMRCNNPNNKDYKNYGGRGIKVCEEWNDSNAFINWALENGYEEGLTIERIDVNGNYEPSNCKWATRLEQARNKRNTRYINYEGAVVPIRIVAEITGIQASTIIQRLDRWGWDEYDAAHIPPRGKVRRA